MPGKSISYQEIQFSGQGIKDTRNHGGQPKPSWVIVVPEADIAKKRREIKRWGYKFRCYRRSVRAGGFFIDVGVFLCHTGGGR